MKKVEIIENEKIAEGCDKVHTLVKGKVMEFSDALADRIVELEFGVFPDKGETKKANPVVENKAIDPVEDDKNSESGDSTEAKPATKKSAKKAKPTPTPK